MAGAKCINIVRGKRLRVTRLDDTLSPPASGTADSLVVSDGFVTVQYEAEVEAAEEITQRNANGDLCVSERGDDSFKRWNLTLDFCEVDPDAIEIITGWPIETDDGGDAVGFRTPEGALDSDFALEVWAGTGASGSTEWGYILLPAITSGKVNSFTVENGAATFNVTAVTQAQPASGTGGWGTGPYDVVDQGGSAAPLATAIAEDEHMLLRRTTIAPPAAECGAQDMP